MVSSHLLGPNIHWVSRATCQWEPHEGIYIFILLFIHAPSVWHHFNSLLMLNNMGPRLCPLPVGWRAEPGHTSPDALTHIIFLLPSSHGLPQSFVGWRHPSNTKPLLHRNATTAILATARPSGSIASVILLIGWPGSREPTLLPQSHEAVSHPVVGQMFGRHHL